LDSKDTNKRVLESLIKCGAFDEISINRSSLIAGYEALLESVSMDRKKNVQGQISLFDAFGGGDETEQFKEIYTMPKLKEYEERDKLSLEKEVLGMYVSGHPLSQFKNELERKTSIDNGKINAVKEDEESYLNLDEREVIMGGMVVNKIIKTTKRNDIMAFLELEDLYGTIEVIVFPQVLQRYNGILNEDNIIYVKGRLNIKEGEDAKIIAQDFKEINDDSLFGNNKNVTVKKQSKLGLYLKINSFSNNELLENIKSLLNNYRGNESVYLFAEDTRQLYKWNEISVVINEKIIKSLENILPSENIKVKS
ncbi:MAG: OB-fold nucleic acid binding domain-containing protein, partial [Peptostreptococcaceae bacterium]